VLKQLAARNVGRASRARSESVAAGSTACSAPHLTSIGLGSMIGSRHFRADRDRRRQPTRAGRHPRLPGGGHRLRPRRRSAMRNWPHFDTRLRQRHSYTYATLGEGVAWVRGLDLGARVHDVCPRRCGRVVRLRREPARGVRAAPARPRLDQRPGRQVRRTHARGDRRPSSNCRPRWHRRGAPHSWVCYRGIRESGVP